MVMKSAIPTALCSSKEGSRMTKPHKPHKPYKRRSSRYRGPCHCGEHAWGVLTSGYVTFVSPEGAK